MKSLRVRMLYNEKFSFRSISVLHLNVKSMAFVLQFQPFSQILQVLTSIKAHPVISVNIIGAAFYSQTSLDCPYLFPMPVKSLVVFFKQFGRIGEFFAIASALVVKIEICFLYRVFHSTLFVIIVSLV